MNNLFTELENKNKQIPLADLLRPKTLEDFLGQENVISKIRRGALGITSVVIERPDATTHLSFQYATHTGPIDISMR